MKDYNALITKDGKPIKILIASKHQCIRCIRIAEALKSVGYEVDALTNKISYGTEIFDKVYYWGTEQQFKNQIYSLKGKHQILEWENEPDTPVSWAAEMADRDKTKIIYNVHDADTIRRGLSPLDERRAYINSDAVIYVSKPIQKICTELHEIKKPTIVLYNYGTKSMLENTKVDWDTVQNRPQTLVYEGGINPIGNTPDIQQMNVIFKYRNLFPIFQQLIQQGNEVHAYAGNSDAYETGQYTGVVLHPPTKFDQLLKELTKFKYNLLVFNNEDGKQDQVNYTTPNKLWDALIAGVPSIACWCKETEKYVKKHDIGWCFTSIKSIGNCSGIDPEYMEKLENVRRKREELIFENQVCLLENLYAEILGVEKKDIPLKLQKQLRFEYGDEAIDKSIRP